MRTKLRISFIAIILAVVLSPEKICNHLGFGSKKIHSQDQDFLEAKLVVENPNIQDYFVNDTVVKWDDKSFDWTVVDAERKLKPKLYSNFNPDKYADIGPDEIKWKTLIDISFKLRYFKDLDLELYAPIFSDEVESLNGKKIIIEGYVIPFDDDEELFALSSFPYASCFFCGKASPASILSMQMKKKSGSYKLDEFKKFEGILYLNYDDPDEFCYVLREAEEA